MFIQTKAGETASELEFFPGQKVLGDGSVGVSRDEAEAKSPLAVRLYAIGGVADVVLKSESVAVAKHDDADWNSLRTEIFGAIVAHFQSGDAALTVDPSEGVGEFDTEIVDQVKDLLATRIVPAVTQSGGDIAFHSYKNGRLYLKLQGSAFSMLTGFT
ncbi:MAG: NifU family protein, partial [Sneathiella sp.]